MKMETLSRDSLYLKQRLKLNIDVQFVRQGGKEGHTTSDRWLVDMVEIDLVKVTSRQSDSKSKRQGGKEGHTTADRWAVYMVEVNVNVKVKVNENIKSNLSKCKISIQDSGGVQGGRA